MRKPPKREAAALTMTARISEISKKSVQTLVTPLFGPTNLNQTRTDTTVLGVVTTVFWLSLSWGCDYFRLVIMILCG